MFKQPTFRVGGTSKTDARLSTDATYSVLRGGTAGLLLDSAQNIDITSAASGKINVAAGSGDLLLSSKKDVKIDSDGTGGIVWINDDMMKFYAAQNKIESIVNSFLVTSSAAGTTYGFINPGEKQFATQNLKMQVRDSAGTDVLTVDPLTTNSGTATMRGKLSVTNNDNTNVFQATPANQTEVTAAVNVSNDYLKINNLTDATRVMTVDMKAAQAAGTVADKGPVYIRKGVMELATNTGTTARALDKHQGYVKADRFVDNKGLDASALSKPTDLGVTFVQQGDTGAYDYYQVNPAYTSVMHDIKLTTRGGARLSDILPDFINKGIYIVDNTYKASSVGDGWAKRDANGYHKDFNPKGSFTDCGSTHSCEVSPWAGFVPSPQCPPGYMKVITLTPATFSMAQAGVPGPITTTKPDLIIDYNVRDPNEYVEGDTGTHYYNKSGYVTTAPTPLYFQKNTWLRSMVIPYLTGANSSTFQGWSTVMGFIYPYTYYKKYIKLLGLTVDTAGGENKTVVWNLFPVYNQTLEGYATVYCYFNRAEATWNKTLVDKTYDQLNAFRAVYTKSNADYNKRLHDPSLGYTDPW